MTITIADARDALIGHHKGQHRCDDGRYYGPRVAAECPMNAATDALCDAIAAETRRVHDAAHDPVAVDAVADGMTGLTMAELAEDDAHGWRMTARYAIEALAAHLDPAVAEPGEPS